MVPQPFPRCPVSAVSASRIIQGSFLGGRPPQAVQRQAAGHVSHAPHASLDLSRQGAGQRLPEPIQRTAQAVLGADLSGVRVHVGPEAASIGALAFTTGSDIFFAPGQLNPASAHGQRLLGHELAHVVQQRQGRVRLPPGSGYRVVHDPGLEAEAERIGLRVAAAVQAHLQTSRAVPACLPRIQGGRVTTAGIQLRPASGRVAQASFNNLVFGNQFALDLESNLSNSDDSSGSDSDDELDFHAMDEDDLISDDFQDSHMLVSTGADAQMDLLGRAEVKAQKRAKPASTMILFTSDDLRRFLDHIRGKNIGDGYRSGTTYTTPRKFLFATFKPNRRGNYVADEVGFGKIQYTVLQTNTVGGRYYIVHHLVGMTAVETN